MKCVYLFRLKFHSFWQLCKNNHDQLELIGIFIGVIFAISAFIVSLFFQDGYSIFDRQKTNIIIYPPVDSIYMRGMYDFKSDQLILPLSWENTKGKVANIQYISLLLHEYKSGKDLEFILMGNYDQLNDLTLSHTRSDNLIRAKNADGLEQLFPNNLIQYRENYDILSSIILEPHQLVRKNSLFFIDNWWNNEHDNSKFIFTYPSCYQVKVKYWLNGVLEVNNQGTSDDQKVLFELPVFGDVSRLTREGDFTERYLIWRNTCEGYYSDK
jgi:hypothetical protein